MKNNKLDRSHFSFVCPMKWENLSETADGRFCDKCQKTIFDLSDCSLEEVAALQKRNGGKLCGYIRIAAIASAVGLSACSSTKGRGEPMMGVICPPPEQNK